MQIQFRSRPLNLESGYLCLDFANTAEWHASPHPHERLTGYPELVEWAQQAGLLAAGDAQRLLAEATLRPEEACMALRRAIALREAIYGLFSASANGLPVADGDLETLNETLGAGLAQLKFGYEGTGFVWNWTARTDQLDTMLWPVAISAAELLGSADLRRVGQCADDRGCGWLFFDTSRNRSRRWCDMKDCGNRAKARRHYQRIKSE
jgi:predicted RNA-binding Zn ribbon-like protein